MRALCDNSSLPDGAFGKDNAIVLGPTLGLDLGRVGDREAFGGS
jgi:hypothetical protein